MGSLNDPRCRLAFLGENAEKDFLESLSTQIAVSNLGFLSVRRLEEYKNSRCDYCVLYSPTGSIPLIKSLVDSARNCRSDPQIILLLLKRDTTNLEKELEATGKPVQIILLRTPDVPPAAELINSYLIFDGQIRPPNSAWGFIGASEPVQKLYRLVESFARWDKDPVLILGDTGTGKELVARHLHKLRGIEDFYAYNLAAVPLRLAESILYGHKKGAFTGAISDTKGLIASAGAGTLLLDEIGEIHPSLQVKLLRTLQEREVTRLGDEKLPATEIQARFVFATNRNLKEARLRGKFREDFLQRIDVLQIRVPSLSERKEDIPLLVKHFVEEFKDDYADKAKDIRTNNLFKLDVLFEHEWTGNVRELRSVVRQAATLTGAGAIDENLAGLVAEKKAKLEASKTPERLSQGNRRVEALGTFMESLLDDTWDSAESRFDQAYGQDLFLKAKEDVRRMKQFSHRGKTSLNALRAKLKRSEFKKNDLRDADHLAARLREGADPISTYIRSWFSRQIREAANLQNGSESPDALVKALVELLNELLQDPNLYQADRFQQIRLSGETNSLIKAHGLWTDLMLLNRLLIEDAYAEAIIKNQTIRDHVNRKH
jgi:DNA-binding NtrC family response regulator